MTKIVKSLIFTALFSVLIFAIPAHAQSINAATCSQADVQAALNSVTVDGTTVHVPAGTCHWTTGLSYSATHSVSIIGAGSQSVVGGGDVTNIVDDVQHNVNGASDSTLSFGTTLGKTFRFSGITIVTGSATVSNNGVFILSGTSQAVRVDHCHFNGLNQVDLTVYGQQYGVFDHNIFDTSNTGVRVVAGGWGGYPNGDGSFADDSTLGSNRYIYFENNVFEGGNQLNDCYQGGRNVFRFNTVNNVSLQTHPTGHDTSAGNDRGCRATEVYKNTFNGNSNCGANFNLCRFNIFFLSAGTALVWGNNAPVVNAQTGSGWAYLLTLHSMRRSNSTYTQSATPNGWGYCGSAFMGTGSGWDQNTNLTMGYACLDDPGRGKSDLLIGNHPNKKNSTTGTIAWPHQALEPVYEWLDTFNKVPNNPGGIVLNQSDVLNQNVDYYVYQTSGCAGTQTTGVCSGTLANRATSCTKGVGYWATDQGSWNQSGSGGQGQLYVCSATNTWSLYYTPYTYPHPLVSGSGSSNNVSAPTNLAVIVQ